MKEIPWIKCAKCRVNLIESGLFSWIMGIGWAHYISCPKCLTPIALKHRDAPKRDPK